MGQRHYIKPEYGNPLKLIDLLQAECAKKDTQIAVLESRLEVAESLKYKLEPFRIALVGKPDSDESEQ